jgi:3D (Asp-Asp-Asp) domain-containing protein
MRFNTKTNTIAIRSRELAAELLCLFGKLLPTTAFVFMNLLPAEVLAFTQVVTQPYEYTPAVLDASVVHDMSPDTYPFRKGSVVVVLATAYSSTPDQTFGNPFITASGTRVRPGVIAANFLPIGTRVRIGNTIYTVEDRLNSRFNNTYRIDIWMESRSQAREFGVRRRVIEIVHLP